MIRKIGVSEKIMGLVEKKSTDKDKKKKKKADKKESTLKVYEV